MSIDFSTALRQEQEQKIRDEQTAVLRLILAKLEALETKVSELTVHKAKHKE